VVENPVVRSADGGLARDRHGQVKVRLGDEEIRLAQDPFPLYPQGVCILLLACVSAEGSDGVADRRR